MKHFGLYNGTLFYTTGGTFATDSWIANNGECVDANISGNSFEAVLADDGKVYNIGTKDLAPISEDEFNKLIMEHMDEVDKAFKDLEKKLPDRTSYAIIPGVDSIFKTNNKELLKKMIDLIIEAYNNHFNDIYIPYTD